MYPGVNSSLAQIQLRRPAQKFFTSTMMDGKLIVQAPSSATWPTANKAFFIPVLVYEPIVITSFWWLNGATVASNYDVGIYLADSDDPVKATKIVSTGSTPASGSANTLQSASVTATPIGPGTYYLAMASDNTTGTIWAFGGGAARYHAAWGIMQLTSAFALPATVTLVTQANINFPTCGFAR